jgi:arylsulfatase
VVIIVIDDMGFADPSCFGSEIDTPAMDRLAADGLRYANFYVTPLCSPTRAALLTGRNHHSAQMAFLAGWGSGPDHTQERMSRASGTIAEILGAAGYSTYAVGKWHLAPEDELSAAGPFEDWPTGRGFGRYYGFLGALTDQYHPALVRDQSFVEPPDRDSYHLSADLVDNAIAYLREHTDRHPASPFLLYLAFGAVHSPLQAPASLVDKYVDRFRKGWDRVRDDRLARQVELGIAPPGTRLTERRPETPAWDSLSADEKRLAVRIQAVYAAFVEHADTQIGRLLDHLDEAGQALDTIVALISDNGASGGGGRTGSLQMSETWEGVAPTTLEDLSELGDAGGPGSFPHYAQGWAMAGNTPFRRYKSYADAGGVRVPLIVRWPARIPDPGSVRRQFCHVVDIVPTILDATGAAPPAQLKLPLDDRTAADREPTPRHPGDRWVLLPTRSRHCISDLARSLVSRSFRLEGEIGPDLPAAGSVIAAAGVPTAFWALVIEDGTLRLLSWTGGRSATISCAMPEDRGIGHVGFDFRFSGPEGGTARVWAGPDGPSATDGVPNLARERTLGTIYVGWCPYEALRASGVTCRLDGPQPGVGKVVLTALD